MNISNFAVLPVLIYAFSMTYCLSDEAKDKTAHSQEFNKVMEALEAVEKDKNAETLSEVLALVKTFPEKVRKDVLLKDPDFVKAEKELEGAYENFKTYRDSKIAESAELKELSDKYSITMIELQKDRSNKEKLAELKRISTEINSYFLEDAEYIKYKNKEVLLNEIKNRVIQNSQEPAAREYKAVMAALDKMLNSK